MFRRLTPKDAFCFTFHSTGAIWYVSLVKLSWDEARVNCKSVLQDLVKIDSSGTILTDFLWFMDYFLNDEVKWAWIGLRRPKDEKFHWLDQTQLGFTAWGARGNPGKGQCVELRPSAGWRVTSCDQHRNYICEKGK